MKGVVGRSGGTTGEGDDATARVLCVDDDPDAVDLTATRIEREADVEAVAATSAREGLELLAERRFDCVVSDYRMPEMDGIEFLDAVRERSDVPFVLFTARGSEAVASEAISAGVTDYVRKGGDDEFAVLAERVTAAVERGDDAREPAAPDRETALDRYETIVETVQDGVYTLDEDGRFTYVNDAFVELTRFDDPAELVGEPISALVDEAAVEAGRRWIAKLRSGDRDAVSYELSLPDETGERRTYDVKVSLLPAPDGEFRGTVGVVRDVTAARERERELELYERIVDAAPDAIYALDEELRFSVVNETLAEIVDESACDLLGDHFDRLVEAGIVDRETYRTGVAAAERLLAGEREQLRLETDVRVDGERLVAENHFSRLETDGEPRGVVNVVRNITERRRRERELREEQAFTRSLFAALPDVFYAFDEEGEFLRWNDRLEEVTGYDASEIASMHPVEFFEDEDAERVAEAIETVFEDGERVTIEADLVTKRGERIPHEFTGAQLRDEAGDLLGLVGVGRDVTARRERERELERQNERLGEFASIVSHDLRNPLTVARGYLDIARKSGDPEDFRKVEDAHERMEELVDDLLTLARNGQRVEETESVELSALASRAWTTVDSEGAALRVEFDDERVDADVERLRSLLENLFRNAVEHAGPAVTVEVGPLADGRGFYVADDGPGILEDERDRVFERGYSTSDDGTGFGLNIVESIAEAHGWTVSTAESERGGARFEVHTGTLADGGP